MDAEEFSRQVNGCSYVSHYTSSYTPTATFFRDIQKTSKELDIAFNTMSSIVKDLISIGVLEQTSAQSRNRTFAYKEYLENCLTTGEKGKKCFLSETMVSSRGSGRIDVRLVTLINLFFSQVFYSFIL